jgi:hypothetical protein
VSPVFSTAYVSLNESFGRVQVETIEDGLLALWQTDEWRAWLRIPAVRASSRAWYVVDKERSTFNRTKLGANYNIAVSEILDAYNAGRLEEWVVEAAYRYANHVSDILGVDPPARPTP